MANAEAITIKRWQTEWSAMAAGLHRQVMDSPWSEAQWSQLNSRFTVGVAAFEQQLLVGVAIFSAIVDEAELQTIAVKASHQGMGIARRLYSQGLAQLPIACNTIFLEVDSVNEPAIGFYHSLDFEACGIRRGYYKNSHGNGDALIMRKEINNATTTH